MINKDKLYFIVICVCFWVMAVIDFIAQELFNTEVAGLNINGIVNAVFIVIGILTIRKKSDIILVCAFVALATASSVYNHSEASEWLADTRRMVAALFMFTVFRYLFTSSQADLFRKSFDRQLKIFLIIQAPCLLEQFLVYGAGDHGGGSLGNWQSGNISILIILISFYFVCQNWDGENYLRSLWENRLYIFLLFPVFLNETKVSFAILFVYFILLLPFNLRSLVKILRFSPIILLVTVGLVGVYLWANDSKYDLYEENFFDTYLTGGSDANEIIEDAMEAVDFTEEITNQVDEGEWYFLDLPRFMKVGMLFPVIQDTRGGFIIGAGLGQMFNGDSLTEGLKVAAMFGTRMYIHHIFYTLGILGLIWYIFWNKNILQFRARPFRMSFKIKLMLLFIVVLVFFYSEFFNNRVGSLVFYYIAAANIYPLRKHNEHSLPVNNHTGL